MMAAAKPTSLGAKVLSMVKYILLSLLAPLNGIEPLPIESESIVLPLYESGIFLAGDERIELPPKESKSSGLPLSESPIFDWEIINFPNLYHYIV